MMLARVIAREGPDQVVRVVLASVLSGAASFVTLSSLNKGAALSGGAGVGTFFAFIIATALWVISANYTVRVSIDLVERATFGMRSRVVEKIRRAELAGMEHVGMTEIVDRVTESLGAISSAAERMVWLPQFVGSLVFSTIYIATISIQAFIISTATLAVGLTFTVTRSRRFTPDIQRTSKQRVSFLEALGDLLKGFKEVKLRDRRRKELSRDIEELAESLRESSLRINILLNSDALFALATRYVLLGVVALVLPSYLNLSNEETRSLVAGLLFLWTPLLFIVNIYPSVIRSNAAAEAILALETKLDEATLVMPRAEDEEHPWGGKLVGIEARDVEFQYQDEGGRGFRVGPLSVSIPANEVVFIVGGNGSGKSTLLKLLTGLYSPRVGSIEADGVKLEPKNIQAYREMIAAVFADFHLFTKLYGLSDVRSDAVAEILSQLDLDGKVAYASGSFSTLNLSTGQRKRLALLVALLEDRPIMAFDEWAADQDPEHRKLFYEEILPELKARGKLVLVVTHDDRYFHLADRIIRLDAGRLRSIDAPASTA